ncbi:MAG: hypothetical protein ACWA5W_01650 [Phycisphaerales bacterium]
MSRETRLCDKLFIAIIIAAIRARLPQTREPNPTNQSDSKPETVSYLEPGSKSEIMVPN